MIEMFHEIKMKYQMRADALDISDCTVYHGADNDKTECAVTPGLLEQPAMHFLITWKVS